MTEFEPDERGGRKTPGEATEIVPLKRSGPWAAYISVADSPRSRTLALGTCRAVSGVGVRSMSSWGWGALPTPYGALTRPKSYHLRKVIA